VLGWVELGSQVPPNILWQCQLIPCSRQEACTAVSPRLELHPSHTHYSRPLAQGSWQPRDWVEMGGSMAET
jgi:hypothetical protein